MHGADAVRIGDADRPGEIACLIDPMRARHLAITIERKHRRPHRRQLLSMPARQDRGHPGAHRPLTDHQIALTFNQCSEADLHPRHIGYRIVDAAIRGKRQAKPTPPRAPIRQIPSRIHPRLLLRHRAKIRNT